MIDLQYPVGKFVYHGGSAEHRAQDIAVIDQFPLQVREATAALSNFQLEQTYRPGGWTLRQVVHHVADSHMHAYLRFKFAATHDGVQILPYPEEIWAELNDARTAPIEPSISLLRGLHARWVDFLRSLDEAAWKRTYHHPDQGLVSIEKATSLYAWHCRHHLAHLKLPVAPEVPVRG